MKGSIAVDGISLTVAEVDGRCLRRVDHPAHARRHQPAGTARRRPVNLEFDMLGKYVEKILQFPRGTGL